MLKHYLDFLHSLAKGIFLTKSSPLIIPITLRNPSFSIFSKLMFDITSSLPSLYPTSSFSLSSTVLKVFSNSFARAGFTL